MGWDRAKTENNKHECWIWETIEISKSETGMMIQDEKPFFTVQYGRASGSTAPDKDTTQVTEDG